MLRFSVAEMSQKLLKSSVMTLVGKLYDFLLVFCSNYTQYMNMYVVLV